MTVTKAHVAKYIEDFLTGAGGPYDWDYFIFGSYQERPGIGGDSIKVRATA